MNRDCEVGESEWLAEKMAEQEALVGEVEEGVLRFAGLGRIQPIPGLMLDGKPVMQDVETGDLVGVSSCDALRIMDGVA